MVCVCVCVCACVCVVCVWCVWCVWCVCAGEAGSMATAHRPLCSPPMSGFSNAPTLTRLIFFDTVDTWGTGPRLS